jgi:hypothetical protein
MLESMYEFSGCRCGLVDTGCCWHGDMMWEPLECVNCAFSAGLTDVDLVTSIVLCCRADVPSCCAVWSPGFPHCWLGVGDTLSTKWAEWRVIEVEGPMYLGLG